MVIALRLLFIVMISIAGIGCGKKSVLEGKVVDGKGQPLTGVKIVAKKVKHLKGYEKVEATTGRDGVFRLDKLYPGSKYLIFAFKDNNSICLPLATTSAPQGFTRVLPEPIEIRFMVSGDGDTAIDTRTGLMWTRDANLPDELSYNEAIMWVARQDIGGYHDWRLPTIDELIELTRYDGLNPLGYLNRSGFHNVLPGLYWSSTVAYDGTAPAENLCATMVQREPNRADIKSQGSSICSNSFEGGDSLEKHHVWAVRDGH